MLNLTALNYTAMLNGYSQLLSIGGGGVGHTDISNIVSVIIAFSHKKMPLFKYMYFSKYCIYVVYTLIWRLNVKLKVYLKTLMLDGINRE